MDDRDCEACEDSGWVLDATDADGISYFRPCGVCRPAVYAKWVEGHFEPGHHCPDCSPAPRGQRQHQRSAPRRVANEPPPPSDEPEPDPDMAMF